MQQAKQLKETFLDPLKFDALLTTFGNAEGSMDSPDKIEDLAQDVLPEVLQQPEEDHLFQSLRTAVEGYPQPCLVVSDLGLIVALNGPAYTAFDLEVSDQIDGCGIETQDTVPLSTQIAQTMAEGREGHQTSFCRAYYKDGERPILLAIVPQHGPTMPRKTALVFFIDIGWDEAISRFIARAYDLSQAEQDVLEMFILGNSLEQIAELRCRSYRTVRTQFYAALSKCGLTSQVDLVREVVTGSMFQSFVPKVANAAKHPHRRELRLLRPGGRTLEVVMSGDVNGAPVFMLASLGPQKFAPEKSRKLKEAGICVYAISPPGLGFTDAQPDGVNRVDCLAEDVTFLMDQVGLSAVPFVCFAANLIGTVRLAQKIPDRMTKIQSWITIPPARFRTKDEAKLTANAVSAMGNAAMISPAMKDLVTRSSLRAWAILGTRKMAKFQTRSEPEITKYLLDPETIEAIDEGFKSATRQGFTKTILSEAEEIHTDWYADAEACPVPITMMHGVKDKTNSIESVRSFAQAFPNKITLVEVADGGGFLHITHEDLHIASLKELVK